MDTDGVYYYPSKPDVGLEHQTQEQSHVEKWLGVEGDIWGEVGRGIMYLVGGSCI